MNEEKIENVKISISAEDISEAKKPTPMKKVEKPAPKKTTTKKYNETINLFTFYTIDYVDTCCVYIQW